MKNISRAFALLLVAVLIFAMVPVTYAAEIEAQPGQTLTVKFSFSGVYSVDGQFSYSNKGMFSSVSYDTSTSNMAGSVVNEYLYIYSTNGAQAVSGSVGVVVKVSSSAKPGDRCTITLNYETGDVNGTMSSWKSMSQTVVIPAQSSSEKPTEPKPTEPKPTDPTQPQPTIPTQPTPTTPKPTTPTKPTTPPTDSTETEPVIDYTELLRQIGIAENLKESDYTKSSWAPLAEAVAAGKELLTSDSQADVDAGAEAIAKAISNLVRVNYTDLIAAINAAEQMQQGSTLGQICNRLHDALARAQELLSGEGDQDEIDALAAEINKILAEAQEEMGKMSQPVEVIKEVEKVAEPSGPYCNIPIHKVWPILFFISLGLNLLLLLLLLLLLKKKKKDQKDDTPMVDYDINDDN